MELNFKNEEEMNFKNEEEMNFKNELENETRNEPRFYYGNERGNELLWRILKC